MFTNIQQLFKSLRRVNSLAMEKLRKVLKNANVKLLFLLENGEKRWSELERVLNKKQVSESLRELIEMQLVKAEERRRGLQTYKIYGLTKRGKKVVDELKKIEEILDE